MTEKSILEILHDKYKDTSKYKVSNIYLFMYGETDFFIQQNSSQYCYDIEIKISRADFFNDFKKTNKHLILKEGHSINYKGEKEVHTFRPNKFFYCVPENLIKVEEIPEYAGLMYVKDNEIFTVKEAPFIHKNRLELEKHLCNRFYWYWKTSENEIKKLKNHINDLENGKNGEIII